MSTVLATDSTRPTDATIEEASRIAAIKALPLEPALGSSSPRDLRQLSSSKTTWTGT